ncbi:hypothetical protein FACS189427_12330 [Planctomycetales bacterium]|nr:hypothetical protein FACS189427_12330 [Planctomycetales bacterium]
MTNPKPERIEDGMIYPSDSRYAIAERAFRRGYHHGVVEFAVHAKNLPTAFRTYAEIYEEQIRDWRWSFNPKDKPVCPPQMQPYSEPLIRDFYYLGRCGICGGKGHLVESETGWSVLCTGTCKRHTQVHDALCWAVSEWDEAEIKRKGGFIPCSPYWRSQRRMLKLIL